MHPNPRFAPKVGTTKRIVVQKNDLCELYYYIESFPTLCQYFCTGIFYAVAHFIMHGLVQGSIHVHRWNQHPVFAKESEYSDRQMCFWQEEAWMRVCLPGQTEDE